MAPKTDADVLPVKSNSEAPDIDVGQVKLMDDRDVDPALKLTGGVVIEFTQKEERQSLRKIDMNMLPLMCWVYMIQFADKTTLNYASLMGIRGDTNLKGNEFSWISSIFYAGYLAWDYDVLPLLSIVTRSVMDTCANGCIHLEGSPRRTSFAAFPWANMYQQTSWLGASP